MSSQPTGESTAGLMQPFSPSAVPTASHIPFPSHHTLSSCFSFPLHNLTDGWERAPGGSEGWQGSRSSDCDPPVPAWRCSSSHHPTGKSESGPEPPPAYSWHPNQIQPCLTPALPPAVDWDRAGGNTEGQHWEEPLGWMLLSPPFPPAATAPPHTCQCIFIKFLQNRIQNSGINNCYKGKLQFSCISSPGTYSKVLVFMVLSFFFLFCFLGF